MIHKLFAIHDAKAAAFLPPFILPRNEMAERTFGDCINATDHQFSQHPDDYTLFELGAFNDEDASYVLHPSPSSLGNGILFVRTEADQPTEGQQNAKATNGKSSTLSDEPSIQSGT